MYILNTHSKAGCQINMVEYNRLLRISEIVDFKNIIGIISKLDSLHDSDLDSFGITHTKITMKLK
jgi:hypothetical protein